MLADVIDASASSGQSSTCESSRRLTRSSLSGLPAGVLVISEFSGFSRVLNGGLRVNPFCVRAMLETIDTALELPPAEREARAQKDLAHVNTNTSEDWGRRFLVDLKSLHKKQEETPVQR